jgi:Mg2+-importing ATPase
VLPFTPLGDWFGFVPLPPWYLVAVAGLTVAYLVLVEVAKHLFHRLRPLNRARPR